MLGPIGSEIMNIFRLLSPDEIDRYIVDEKTSIMVGSVAAGGESLSLDTEDSHHGQYSKKKKKFAKDHQAEIIPLSEHKEKQAAKQFLEENDRYPEQENELSRENVEAKAKKVAESTHDLSSIGVLSASSIREIENERLKKENGKKDSATVFLLKERQKMRESKKRLTEQTALKMYQVNSSQEFHEQSDDDLLDEESANDLRGILLNKKQY